MKTPKTDSNKHDSVHTLMSALRKKGYQIRVTHYRWTQYGLLSRRQIRDENAAASRPIDRHVINPCGGKVVVEISVPAHQQIPALTVTGECVCSREDNFIRRLGTTKAFGRALSALQSALNSDSDSQPVLTPEQKRRYLQSPNHCPFCQSANIEGGEVTFEPTQQYIACLDCRREWRDHLTVPDVTAV